MRSPLAWYAEGAILAYQKLAPPRLRQACRFTPTCSHYGLDAVRAHGGLRGIALTAKRLGRCRPPHGGEDPVPAKS